MRLNQNSEYIETDLPGRPDWERLPGEPNKAWAAFTAYRNLPLGERSLRNAYRIVMNRPTATAAARRWEIWSSMWDWMARARAWDAEQDRIQRETIKAQHEANAREIAEKRHVWRMRRLELADRMIQRVQEMMAHPLTRQYFDEARGTFVIEPTRWQQSDVVRMLKLANDFVDASTRDVPDEFTTYLVERSKQGDDGLGADLTPEQIKEEMRALDTLNELFNCLESLE